MLDHSALEWEKIVDASTGFCSDSRCVRADDIFVALRGRHGDGHDFLSEAVSRGARAVVVDAHSSFSSDQAQVIKVNDTAATHRHLAGIFRRKSSAPLIAVAGSNGKTTTTQCLAHLCQPYWSLIATQDSQNGIQGIPKTLEQLRPDTELMIVEVGIDSSGAMQGYWDLLRPDICILTSIGAEHMERFESLESVFKEETILLRGTLRMGGYGIVPDDDSWLNRLPDHPRLRRVGSQTVNFEHPYPHQKTNLALAAAATGILGISTKDLNERISSFSIPEGRGQLVQYRDKTWIVLDHYNANPDSMRLSIKATQTWARNRGLAWHGVLGDMLDLGGMSLDAHRQILADLQLSRKDSLTLVGSLFNEASQSYEFRSLVTRIGHSNEPLPHLWQKEGLYLLKGSRGMKMERLLDDKESENRRNHCLVQ